MLLNEFVYPCANKHILNKELEDSINKFGSFLTLSTNKPISCITFFILLQNNKVLRDMLVDITGVSWYSIVEYMAYRYPVLNKSKKIKNENT